jgi:hypothetical protein
MAASFKKILHKKVENYYSTRYLHFAAVSAGDNCRSAKKNKGPVALSVCLLEVMI